MNGHTLAGVSIKVLIADDHAMFRGALGRLIDSEPDLQVVALAHDGASTLQQLADNPCDVLLLDLTMPEPSGSQLISLIREKWPQQRLLVVSMLDTPRIVRTALDAGANGYITKDSEPATLLQALRVVAAGGRHVEPSLMEAMLFAPAPAPKLTPRETEILKRLAAGQSNSAIARSLYITDKTVSSHKANLMAKLSIQNLADLLRYAMDHGLAPKV
ncbi:MAG: response regulator transcription factor [Polaromonas sp.]|nr:response regulator transcription factor [Polaromonas sp.]